MRQTNEVYVYLRKAITSGEIGQGEPIKEVKIANQLGVSRTLVREALRDLASDGLVDTFQYQGCFVSRITAYDVQEISELRKLIEIWSLRRSINKISDEEIEELKAAFQENESWEARHEADRKLHSMITQRSGSKRAQEFLNIINAQIERLRILASHTENRLQFSFQEHMKIIEAIESRDLDAACQALSDHLDAVKENCLLYMSENAL